MLRTRMSRARNTTALLVGPLLAMLGCGAAPVSTMAGGVGTPSESSSTRPGSSSSVTPASAPPVAVRASPAAPSAPADPSEAPVAPAASAAPSAILGPAEYSTPLLDEPELARAIRASCHAALASKRPMLLEFSAPWCDDCRVLERLKREPALASELARWQLLPINIGDGNAHPGLMRAFQVRAIAKLVVVIPSDCAAPIDTWPRGATRTLDGLRKQADHAEEGLASWLASVRENPARR
jgi:hypothetical protein